MKPTYPHIDSAVDELKDLLGDRLSTTNSIREHHGTDFNPRYPVRPSLFLEFHGNETGVAEQVGVVSPFIGHVGDGNVHLALPFNPENQQEAACVRAAHERLIMRGLAMDGTCTGEHGIGLGKLDYLIAEHGEGVDVMRSIKQALDPDNIMNPGKVLRV